LKTGEKDAMRREETSEFDPNVNPFLLHSLCKTFFLAFSATHTSSLIGADNLNRQSPTVLNLFQSNGTTKCTVKAMTLSEA
jgi:hypothetical protein